MDCIPVCPTGSIDEWRIVTAPYTLEQQYEMEELPEQEEIEAAPVEEGDADPIAALLAEAHKGAGGKAKAPASAAKPAINMYNLGKPAKMTVQGNYRLTDDPDHDVRHIILDPGASPFPVLEGQSVGIIPPGTDAAGNAHLPRLYSVSSPRDGTGSAPMRAFTMQRQRSGATGGMTMFFGARTPESLPYFGPLKKIPERLLKQHLVFSRLPDQDKEYVQDRMIAEQDEIAALLQNDNTHIYICGLRGMEEGVELAMTSIAESIGEQWTRRDA
ncbi:Benzoyl-CoA oxygenase component A [Nymphon striatum]|nr:Benzoyl-CoA oxygenase component A [Nymphon striatum]